ncbi:MAG: tyrosine-type recombinase/integrase [Cellvibrionaceae bacterium]
MASFRKLPSGKWEYAVSVDGVRKSKSFSTKAAGRSWASETEMLLGKKSGLVGDFTLAELFDRYASEISESKKGARWEIIRLNKFKTYAISSIKLTDLQREDIEQWIDERLRTVKASSVNRELNLVSHCLTQARRWRWMNHSPMADLRRPKNPPARDRRIKDIELETLAVVLGYSEDIPVETQRQKVFLAVLFAIETAMRASEICSLTDIDEKNRTAYLSDTKNGHARYVPLSSEAIRLWERLPNGCFDISAGAISTHFTSAVNKSGIKDLTFHDSRHEAITRLANKMGVLDLARMTGHKNIKELSTYYNASASEIAKLLD